MSAVTKAAPRQLLVLRRGQGHGRAQGAAEPRGRGHRAALGCFLLQPLFGNESSKQPLPLLLLTGTHRWPGSPAPVLCFPPPAFSSHVCRPPAGKHGGKRSFMLGRTFLLSVAPA